MVEPGVAARGAQRVRRIDPTAAVLHVEPPDVTRGSPLGATGDVRLSVPVVVPVVLSGNLELHCDPPTVLERIDRPVIGDTVEHARLLGVSEEEVTHLLPAPEWNRREGSVGVGVRQDRPVNGRCADDEVFPVESHGLDRVDDAAALVTRLGLIVRVARRLLGLVVRGSRHGCLDIRRTLEGVVERRLLSEEPQRTRSDEEEGDEGSEETLHQCWCALAGVPG